MTRGWGRERQPGGVTNYWNQLFHLLLAQEFAHYFQPLRTFVFKKQGVRECRMRAFCLPPCQVIRALPWERAPLSSSPSPKRGRSADWPRGLGSSSVPGTFGMCASTRTAPTPLSRLSCSLVPLWRCWRTAFPGSSSPGCGIPSSLRSGRPFSA